MGADLIGYLIVGPAKITKAKIEKCIKEVGKTMRIAYEMKHIEDLEESLRTPAQARALQEFIDGHPSIGVNCIDTVAEWIDHVGPLQDLQQVRQMVLEFVDFWENSSARDVYARTDPNNPKRQILFAGEMSWGDSPEGYGYTTIDQAERLGILEMLGIK